MPKSYARVARMSFMSWPGLAWHGAAGNYSG